MDKRRENVKVFILRAGIEDEMIKISYTFIISIVYLLTRYLILTIFQIEPEFFFLIGTISVVILYFIKELPLLYLSFKKSFQKRFVAYLLSGFITSLLFSLFYMNLGELAHQFKEILLLSLELHLTAVLIYYFPVEIYIACRRQS